MELNFSSIFNILITRCKSNI